MEHKVVQYLRAIKGDKSLFRHWHKKFTTALGQVSSGHEEIVQRMVKDIDLGKGFEKVVTTVSEEYGDEFARVSNDIGTF
jgi:hypothetical protein